MTTQLTRRQINKRRTRTSDDGSVAREVPNKIYNRNTMTLLWLHLASSPFYRAGGSI